MDLHWKEIYEITFTYAKFRESFVDIISSNNLHEISQISSKVSESDQNYFRKKDTSKKEPQKRRVYIGVQKELLEAMDEHIVSNINNADYKPSDGFSLFCKEKFEILKEEVNRLCKAGFTDSNEIKDKIKKTYKNRYFILVTK